MEQFFMKLVKWNLNDLYGAHEEKMRYEFKQIHSLTREAIYVPSKQKESKRVKVHAWM